MSNLFDTFTQSGRLLQDGYDRLISVDYDPTCEMVDVINDYDDLPSLELEVESMKNALDRLQSSYKDTKDDFEKRFDELSIKISNAEIKELSNE